MLTISSFMPDMVKRFCKRALRWGAMILLAGNRVRCPVCGWRGRRFSDGSWHKRSICPGCRSDTRHRLLRACISYLPQFDADVFLAGKDILHFAPARPLRRIFRDVARRYVTADLVRADADLLLDISHMPTVASESYDRVIAFDVLEHVRDDRKAIREIHRVLRPGGVAILSVPQKDGSPTTYEDNNITSPEGRRAAFGEPAHLRVYGADFDRRVASRGFSVEAIDEGRFDAGTVHRHVLAPPKPSRHPLATNHRKIFFCRKRDLATGREEFGRTETDRVSSRVGSCFGI